MTILARSVLLLSLAVVLGGCPSVDLVRMDNDWRSTYKAMSDQDDVIAGTESYRETLKSLSQRAKDAGDKSLTDSRSDDAIAFYRIAALAGWKSRITTEDSVSVIISAGKNVCTQIDGKIKRPLDCALFHFVPAFASNDYQVKNLWSWYPNYAVRNDLIVRDDEYKSAAEAYTALSQAVDSAASAAIATDNYPVAKEFRTQFVRQNWQDLYCNLLKVANVLRNNESSLYAGLVTKRKADVDAELKAVKDKLSPHSAKYELKISADDCDAMAGPAVAAGLRGYQAPTVLPKK